MKQNWEYKKLGDVCNFQGGSQPPKDEWSKEPKEKYVRMLQIRDFTQSATDYIEYVKESKSLKFCKDNDILLGRYGASVGKVLTGLSGAYNVAIIKSIPNESILKKDYLKVYFQSSWFQQNLAVASQQRAAQAGFSKEDIADFRIPVPSLSEQKKIVAELDLLTGIIDKQKVQLKELDSLAQSIFYDMFGDPIENEKDWDVKTIKDIGKVVTGNTPSRQIKEYYDKPYIEWIKSDNLSNDTMYASEAREYLSELGMSKARVLPKGTTLVTCIAGSLSTIGTASLVDRNVSFNQQINAIIPNKKLVSSVFVLHSIRRMGEIIRSHATNGMKHIITKAVFEKQPFILPPLALQQEFADKIQYIEKQKATINQSIADTQKLLDYTMDKYFG